MTELNLFLCLILNHQVGSAFGANLVVLSDFGSSLGLVGNVDGCVDILDFGFFVAGFGKAPPVAYFDGDLDRKEVVDIEDFGIFAAKFGAGATAGPGTTPEPATLALMGVSALLTLRRRR